MSSLITHTNTTIPLQPPSLLANTPPLFHKIANTSTQCSVHNSALPSLYIAFPSYLLERMLVRITRRTLLQRHKQLPTLLLTLTSKTNTNTTSQGAVRSRNKGSVSQWCSSWIRRAPGLGGPNGSDSIAANQRDVCLLLWLVSSLSESLLMISSNISSHYLQEESPLKISPVPNGNLSEHLFW